MLHSLSKNELNGLKTPIDISKLEPPKEILSFEGISSPKDLHLAITLFIRSLFAQYNLTGWTFKGYDNAKTRAGWCLGGKHKVIGLSKHFVLNNTAEEIKNTIVHEIAHAIDNEIRGKSNHDDHWRSIALALGDDGHRCYDSTKVAMPVGKYLYVCPEESCKREVRYHKRKSNTACGVCCKKYNRGRYHEGFKLVYKGISIIKVEPIVPPQVSMAAHAAKASSESNTSKPKSKSDQMRALYDSGITSISEIAKQVGAHYSHVRTVINRHETYGG